MCRPSARAHEGVDIAASDDGSTSTCQKRVVLWGPPRSLSTAVERALVEHKEIQVMHEPFGTPHYWSSEAASSREGSDAQLSSATFASVAKQIFRADPPAGKRYIFSKNLSYYFAPHCLPSMSAFLEGDYSRVVHSFIIRHPAKAVSSLYYKSCIDNEKTGYTHFDPDEAGFTAMRDILEHVEQQPGTPPIVIIDADDLLYDPEGIMTQYCEAVGLPFNPSMLSWTPGPVKELESPWTGWTDDVINSSGITRRPKISPPPNTDSLPPEVRETIAEALPIYEAMFERRLRPTIPEADEAKPNTKVATKAPVSIIGMLLLLVSVLIWVTQAELLKTIHSDGWNKPYFQAVMLKSVWAFVLPIWYLSSTVHTAMQEEITFRRPLQPTFRVVSFSLLMMVLVLAASTSFIASLSLTSVSVNTAIYNVNPLIVYLFSIPLLGEKPSVTKSAAVVIAGIAATAVAQGATTSGDPTRGILGASIVLLSATIYSLKEVLFKRFFASVSVSLTPFTDSLLVVAIIGIGSAVVLVPSVVVLHYSGIESFELPTVELARSYGVVACLMAVYQACLLAAIALTSPTFVAMGSMLTVPASMMYDYIVRGYVVPPLSQLGIVGVIIAFGMLFFSGTMDSGIEAICCCCCPKTRVAPSTGASKLQASGSAQGSGAAVCCKPGDKRELV